jgi:ABC-type cobalamin/Fe3+-siderophores transport system ATPase subunit
MWTIEGKTLLDNISFTAGPGTLTAVIGPSGAGKSSLAKLIAGYTQPTDGALSFEGHNIHADYASFVAGIAIREDTCSAGRRGPRYWVERSVASDAVVGWAAREVTMRGPPIELMKLVAPTPVSVTTAPRRIVGEKHRNWSR